VYPSTNTDSKVLAAVSAWVGKPANKPAKIRVPAATTMIGNESLSFLTGAFWGKGAAEPISCRIRAISLSGTFEQLSEYQGRSENADRRAKLHVVQLFSIASTGAFTS
jgi:hypothetical protein